MPQRACSSSSENSYLELELVPRRRNPPECLLGCGAVRQLVSGTHLVVTEHAARAS